MPSYDPQDDELDFTDSTIDSMARRIASGNVGHAATTRASSGSDASAPDSAPPSPESAILFGDC
ncbi:MAG TPA: hypothetical protein VGL71_10155 [Urbifossiella sp.]